MYLIGIDDAGRGPILGPMFLAGVLIKSTDEKVLKELGAKDSKLLTHPQRIAIAEQIKKNSISIEIAESSPGLKEKILLNRPHVRSPHFCFWKSREKQK